jgi:membrane protease subunit HflK
MANAPWPDEAAQFLEQLETWYRKIGPGGVGFIVAVIVVALLMWSSWYTVQPEETAVVQRFGRVVRTESPGLHFKLPFGIETVRLVPTARILKEEFGFRTLEPGRRTRYSQQDLSTESLMLTGDLNVIDVQWIVQYRIDDPVRFLFDVRRPRDALRDVSEAVMRRIVGNRLASDVLTVGRAGIASKVKADMQKILSEYKTGIRLVTVELQDVTPPDPVKPAFNEVNEARQDKERMINQAQEQANKEVPKARGEARRSITEAEGYSIERVNRAEGEAARFTAVLAQYRDAPKVTRRRLYLEAMKKMLGDSKGIYVIDSAQRALVPWLSLDANGLPRVGGEEEKR